MEQKLVQKVAHNYSSAALLTCHPFLYGLCCPFLPLVIPRVHVTTLLQQQASFASCRWKHQPQSEPNPGKASGWSSDHCLGTCHLRSCMHA